MSSSNSEQEKSRVFLKDISTPTVILPSYYGHLLYTPHDLYQSETNRNLLTQLDVGDLIQKDFRKRGIHELSNIPSNLVHVLSYWGPLGPPASCDSNSLSIHTKAGRRKLDLAQYKERIDIDKPAVVVALADEVSMNVGNNRMKKAVSRTWSWFKEFVSLPSHKAQIFGVLIADPHHPNQADNMIDQLIGHGCDGIVIGGAHLDGLGVNRAGMTSLEYRRKITKKIRDKSSTVFLMTQGADAFDSVIEDLDVGVDLIHSNYPLHATKRGCAFNPMESTFMDKPSQDPHANEQEGEEEEEDVESALLGGKKRKRGSNEKEKSLKQQQKKFKVDPSVTTITANNENPGGDEDSEEIMNHAKRLETLREKAKGYDSFTINLWDFKYEKDRSPLMAGCQCHACTHHSRAYIHHLLKSNELTADVLLYQHNQFQILRVFEEAREAIKSEMFESWKKSRFPTINEQLNQQASSADQERLTVV